MLIRDQVILQVIPNETKRTGPKTVGNVRRPRCSVAELESSKASMRTLSQLSQNVEPDHVLQS